MGEVLTIEESFPAGSFVVPTAQNLGRLVAHMLEVETEDNVVYWNTMDAWLPRTPEAPSRFGQQGNQTAEPRPPLVPIYKIMAPVALPTSLVR